MSLNFVCGKFNGHAYSEKIILHIGIFIKPLKVSVPYNILINKIGNIGQMETTGS